MAFSKAICGATRNQLDMPFFSQLETDGARSVLAVLRIHDESIYSGCVVGLGLKSVGKIVEQRTLQDQGDLGQPMNLVFFY